METFKQDDAEYLKGDFKKEAQKDERFIGEVNKQIDQSEESNKFWGPIQVPHREAELARAKEARGRGEKKFTFTRMTHMYMPDANYEKEINLHIKDLEFEIAGLKNQRPPNTHDLQALQGRLQENLSDIKNLKTVLNVAEERLEKIRTDLKSGFDPVI